MTKAKPPPDTEFSDEIAVRICEAVANRKSISDICEEMGLTQDRIFSWLYQKPDFRALYHSARANVVVAMGEEILQIADDDAGDTMESATRDGKIFTTSNGAAVARARASSSAVAG